MSKCIRFRRESAFGLDMILRLHGSRGCSSNHGSFLPSRGPPVDQWPQWLRHRSKGARSFRGQKSSSQVTRMHFLPPKKLTTFFSCRPQNTGRQRRFTVKIKRIKRSDMVTFLIFCSHYYRSKAIRRARQGGGSSWRALV